MRSFDITRHDAPCCYFLSTEVDGRLVVFVHEQTIDELLPMLERDREIVTQRWKEDGMREEFRVGLNSGEFGFGGRIKVERAGSFFKFVVPWPIGNYKDLPGALAITGSLSMLFSYLGEASRKTTADFPQALVLATMAEEGRGGHGSSLGGTFSRALMRWLVSLGDARLPEVEEAMTLASRKMFGSKPDQEAEIKATVRGQGVIGISCWGDACDIYLCDTDFRKDDEGEDFTCHNVGNPWQQIQLLIGLAVLTTLFFKAMGFGDRLPK